MLVIDRKSDAEGVWLIVDGKRCLVRVKSKGGRVKVCIDAPKEVLIVREELERGAA